MTLDQKRTLKRVGIAGGIAAVLLAAVTGFASLQAPDEAPELELASAPIALPPADLELPETPEAPAVPDLPDETEPDVPEPPPELAEAPKKPKKRTLSLPTPAPVPKPVVTSPPQPDFSTRTIEDGFKVKFASIDALASLVADDHVTVVIEYPDGVRFLLPRDLDDRTVSFELPEKSFLAWVAAGSVSELVPNQALLDRLEVHQDDVRYLAVLDDELRAQVAQAAVDARVDPHRSVLLIEEGPHVTVALARR